MKRLFSTKADSQSSRAKVHWRLPHPKTPEPEATATGSPWRQTLNVAQRSARARASHSEVEVELDSSRGAGQSPAAPIHEESMPAVTEPSVSEPPQRNPTTSRHEQLDLSENENSAKAAPPATDAVLPDEAAENSRAEMESMVPPEMLVRPPRAPGVSWKKVKHSLQFVNMTSASVKDRKAEATLESVGKSFSTVEREAGSDPHSLPKEASSNVQFKPRGRKGMDSLQVRQDKSLTCRFRDVYAACLKMPPLQFLVGVFSSPVLLGLLFTPLYLLDSAGMHFEEGVVAECPPTASALEAALSTCGAALNVFLYALSISTTFGGAPVAAVSPFTLMVANLNVLCAQFLFVLLSGAVFARMSQPSQAVRCSKKAILRSEDVVHQPNSLGEGAPTRHRVLAMRLVLSGPSPCELLDVRVGFTFRIFVRLPSGAMFCSTRDLTLVRSELSYLRYGLMCRHVIDESSPLYGHTMETLKSGDASLSVTVVGIERTSMQSIFHMHEYFAFDGDLVWDGDFHDFVYVNEKGVRVLDHTRLDHMKHFKVGGMVSQAISRMGVGVKSKREEEEKAKAEWGVLREKRGHVMGDIGDAVSEISSTVSDITSNIATNLSQNLPSKISYNRTFSFSSWTDAKAKIRKGISPSSSKSKGNETELTRAGSFSRGPWLTRVASKMD